MHKVSTEPETPTFIDNRLVRANATLTTLILALALIAPNILTIALLTLQALAFSLAIWVPKWNLYTRFSKGVNLPRLYKRGEPEHPKAIRFSQEVGLLFTLPALTLLSLGYSAGLVLVAFCLIASALNAFAGVCLACLIYPRLSILKYRLRHILR